MTDLTKKALDLRDYKDDYNRGLARFRKAEVVLGEMTPEEQQPHRELLDEVLDEIADATAGLQEMGHDPTVAQLMDGFK